MEDNKEIIVQDEIQVQDENEVEDMRKRISERKRYEVLLKKLRNEEKILVKALR